MHAKIIPGQRDGIRARPGLAARGFGTAFAIAVG
jgi:hypothetical protein